MPLLSSHLLIQASSLTLVTLSYMLLSSPLAILQSPSVDLLGSSMHVPPAAFVPPLADPLMLNDVSRSNKNPLFSLRATTATLPQSTRELLALISLLLFLAALSQSVLATGLRYSRDGLLQDADGKRKDTRALGEAVHTLHNAQTQWMALAALRVLTTGGLVAWIYLVHGQRYDGTAEVNVQSPSTGVGLLANRIIFAVGMTDMLFWGYLWTVLKEEVRELAELVAKRRVQDEEDEQNERR